MSRSETVVESDGGSWIVKALNVSPLSHATNFVTQTKLISVLRRIMNRSKYAVWNDCWDSCTCLATSPLPFYTTVPALLVETVHSCFKPSQRYTWDALKQCEVIWRSLSTVDVSRRGLNGNKDVVIRPMPAIFDPTVSWDDIGTVEFLKRLIYLLQYRRLNQLLHNETVWDGFVREREHPIRLNGSPLIHGSTPNR